MQCPAQLLHVASSHIAANRNIGGPVEFKGQLSVWMHGLCDELGRHHAQGAH